MNVKQVAATPGAGKTEHLAFTYAEWHKLVEMIYSAKNIMGMCHDLLQRVTLTKPQIAEAELIIEQMRMWRDRL